MSKPDLDPYAILGVACDASAADIRAAYLDLVARYHPDRHQGNPLEGLATDKMAEVNQAWEMLSDPDRRAAYDRDHPRGMRQPDQPVSPMRGGVRKRRPWFLLLGLLLFLPLLIRLLAALGRVVFRGLSEALSVGGGIPIAMIAVALALVIAILLVVRRRRTRR